MAGWAGERTDGFATLHFGGVRARGGLPSDRVVKLLGDWYERSAAVTGRGYADWFVPATIETVEVLLALDDLDEPLVSLGAGRAHHGYTEIEALTDLSALADVAPGRLRPMVEAPRAIAALSSGFDSVDASSFAPSAFVGDAAALVATIDEHGRSRIGASSAETLAAVVVDAAGPEDARGAPGHAVHVTAVQIAGHFPAADRLFWLSGGRFAVLVWRHPGLARSVAELEEALAAQHELDGVDVNVWVEPAPGAMAEPASWVTRITQMQPPARAAREVRVASLLVDTPRSVHAVDDARVRENWRRRFGDIWDQGLSLVATAVVVLLVAAGLGRVVGPLDRGGETRGDLVARPFFGQVPSGDDGDRAVSVETPVTRVLGKVVEAAPVSVVDPPRAVPAPSSTAGERPRVPPARRAARQTEERGADAPAPDPCADLDRGRAKACERRAENERRGRKGEAGEDRREARRSARSAYDRDRDRTQVSTADDRDDRGHRDRRRAHRSWVRGDDRGHDDTYEDRYEDRGRPQRRSKRSDR